MPTVKRARDNERGKLAGLVGIDNRYAFHGQQKERRQKKLVYLPFTELSCDTAFACDKVPLVPVQWNITQLALGKLPTFLFQR